MLPARRLMATLLVTILLCFPSSLSLFVLCSRVHLSSISPTTALVRCHYCLPPILIAFPLFRPLPPRSLSFSSALPPPPLSISVYVSVSLSLSLSFSLSFCLYFSLHSLNPSEIIYSYLCFNFSGLQLVLHPLSSKAHKIIHHFCLACINFSFYVTLSSSTYFSHCLFLPFAFLP